MPVAAQQIEADGAAALGVALRRLGTTKRVLMIGAHPDDENTALLAELALGEGADVAYLSLTRGEGGQNLIGPELQEGLGLIRTEELLAARRLDGARQFFTRAYDYGFSKSAQEAFSQWPRDSLLSDVVAVVRRFRPDIIVSVFSGTPADGHGQHQAAGIMARDAFIAAGDAQRFTAHRAPHSPRYLFQVLWNPGSNPPLRMATGALDPLFGRSRHQIAMQSRSRHRSQDMGQTEPLGPQSAALRVLDGSYPDGARSLFAGVDSTLLQHARTAGAPAEVMTNLDAYERDIAQLRSSFNPLQRAGLVEGLVRAIRRLDTAVSLLTPQHAALRRVIMDERAQALDALRMDAGVVVDVVADTPLLVPGTSFNVTARVWNSGPATISATLWPQLPAGWTVSGDSSANVGVDPGTVLRRTYRITIPPEAATTEPYFLRMPRAAAMYSWQGVADSVRALPFEAAPVRVRFGITAGARIAIDRDAEFVTVDKAIGEVRRPLMVVPAANVLVAPRVLVVPAGHARSSTVAVTVAAARDSLRGVLRLDAPAGWRVTPARVDVSLARAGENRTVEFDVVAPPNADGQHVLHAAFDAGVMTYDEGYTVIDYPHIRPHPLYHDATVRVSTFPVQLAQDLRIGYIEGAGDDGAEALAQMGAHVEMLDAAALANGDLARYDAIVAGIRAYEVRPDLLANNARLLDYARAGGVFVVQYNKYELVQGGFMPYPATMAQPHGRVTDENARVALLEPSHPALSWPNRIGAADFDGWVQERGLYFLDSWDARYTPLLSMADPGEEAQQGALVTARVGSGWYAYTGLSLFRQLPEGVPGAYRLLANLVSLKRAPVVP